MTTATEILKQIKDNDVKFVDLRFTDPRGKMQHVTMDVSCVDEDIFADGVMFDGSSIAGWKAINESDMVLMPDTTTPAHGSVLRPVDHGRLLRHSRPDHRRSLQPRSAHHGQEG
jgi:glutamine synthetase